MAAAMTLCNHVAGRTCVAAFLCFPAYQAHADDLTALASEVAALQVTAAALDADEGEGVMSHQISA